jgi:hypothetical protein
MWSSMHLPGGLTPSGSCLKQALPDEFALCDPARTGKETAAGVGHELVEHVELRHLVENLDKTGPRITLIAHEKRPASYSMPWRQGGQRSVMKFTPSLYE